jgi:hypothetical protein
MPTIALLSWLSDLFFTYISCAFPSCQRKKEVVNDDDGELVLVFLYRSTYAYEDSRMNAFV